MKPVSRLAFVALFVSVFAFMFLGSPGALLSQPAKAMAFRVAVTPNPAEVEPGGTVQFSALVKDRTGATVPLVPQWKVIPEKLGSIDANGLFVASGVRGRGIVRAIVKTDAGNGVGNSLLRVGNPPGKTLRVVVTPKRVHVEIGGTQEFKAEILGPSEATANATVEWKVIPDKMGSVTTQGIFTAGTTDGACKVLAVVSNGTEKAFDQAGVLIGKPAGRTRPVVRIMPKQAQVDPGTTQQFTAEVFGPDGASIPDAIINWKILPEKLGAITGTGLFTAGNDMLRGQVIAETEIPGMGKAFDAAAVAVGKPEMAARLVVRPMVAQLAPGATQQFTAELISGGGAALAVSPVWKVAPEKMGSITSEGLFTAGQTPGEARIVAEFETARGRLTGMAGVAIRTGAGTGTGTGQAGSGDYKIEITPAGPVIVKSGGTRQFEAKVFQAGQLVDKQVQWTVRPMGLGTINAAGLFTAGPLGMRVPKMACEVIATIRTDAGRIIAKGVTITVTR